MTEVLFEITATGALYGAALLLSAVWFGAAFRLFSLQNVNAAKLLVPRSQRDSPLFDSIAAFTPFLGGFNAALAFLCSAMTALFAFDSELLAHPSERGLLLLVVALAHFSQFWFNVPVLRAQGADPNTLWPVIAGPMRRIFLGDLALALFTFAAAVTTYLSG